MEKRLIDANNAISVLKILSDKCCDDNVFEQAISVLESSPTIDAVEVVRCKDCKYNKGTKVWLDGDVTIDCDNGMGYPPPDWFCADGERREQDDLDWEEPADLEMGYDPYLGCYTDDC